MGIARARQMAGRRKYPNDIRDNKQREGFRLAVPWRLAAPLEGESGDARGETIER